VAKHTAIPAPIAVERSDAGSRSFMSVSGFERTDQRMRSAR
jgi:hypothetical protein